jgi:hypothetical protein
MKKSEQAVGRLARKLHECLAQEGIQAELEVSEHEGTVAARTEVEGQPLRAIVHVSDRDLLPSAHGSLGREEARARVMTAAVRPTLEQRSASGRNHIAPEEIVQKPAQQEPE